MVKRKNEYEVASSKAGKVACAFCGKSYKARGLTRHQKLCGRRLIKRREFCFESSNVNAFAHILSFLCNQSVVKLQAATGALYNGSNSVVSAVCCICEKDSLVIANGLCLVCNNAKNPRFSGLITASDTRKLYGVHDIKDVTLKMSRSLRYRGYDSFVAYRDIERKAVEAFGSKKKWLEHIAPKLLAKRRAEKEYKALLATCSKDFQTFVELFSENGLMTEEQLRERAARLDSVCEKLTARSLDIGYFTDTKAFVLENVGTAEEVAESIKRKIQEKEHRKQDLEAARGYIETLPKEAVKYLLCRISEGKRAIEARYTRYCELIGALAARGLELRSGSQLSYEYIHNGKGAVDYIVDTMEELKFLNTHTSYAKDCNNIVLEPRRWHNPWSWSDSDDSYDSDNFDDEGYSGQRKERREEIKRRFKKQYLRNSHGLTLPAVWLRERESRAAARQAPKQRS